MLCMRQDVELAPSMGLIHVASCMLQLFTASLLVHLLTVSLRMCSCALSSRATARRTC